MADLEISKMLVLSMSHLTEATYNSWLPEWDGPAYEKRDYGWFVPLFDDIENTLDGAPDLLACVKFAETQDCTWIMFDRDAYMIDQLPTYDW